MAKPKEGANKGNAGKGRPKGAVNKTTKAAKEAIALAADSLGGAERLTAWAQESPENERAFWVNIYPKLIPVTLAGDAENPLRTITRIELVDLNGDGAGSTPA